MERIIASRTHELSDELKAFINDELARFDDASERLTSTRVILSEQRAWHTVDVIVHGRNIEIEASAKATEPHAAIHAALDKAERQLRKHIDKIKDLKHQSSISELELKHSEELADADVENVLAILEEVGAQKESHSIVETSAQEALESLEPVALPPWAKNEVESLVEFLARREF